MHKMEDVKHKQHKRSLSFSLFFTPFTSFLLGFALCTLLTASISVLYFSKQKITAPVCGLYDRKMFAGYESYCEPCGMNDTQVMAALSSFSADDCGFGAEKRSLFLDGEWLFWNQSDLRAHDPKGPPVCGLYCVSSPVCQNGTCLVPTHMRPGSSDFLAARQIFVEGQLNVFEPTDNFSTILDAGANVGLASLYFTSFFPNATIVMIEPSSLNFEVLKLNLKRNPNAIYVHSALWSSLKKLALVSHSEEWGFRAIPFDKLETWHEVLASMQGVSVEFLLDVFGLPGFDFMKIDIEGSEGEIFSSRWKSRWKKWLSYGKLAALEVHDGWWPNASQIVERAFDSSGRWTKQHDVGEHNIWRAG